MSSFLKHVFASSPAVIYTCRASGDFGATFISDNIKEQLGYLPQEFLADSGFWKKNIHPDDTELVFAGLGELFAHGHHTHEYRFRAKDGSYRWMRDELRLLRNEETGTDELIGSWLDITERKEMEENYRRLAGLTSDYVHYCTRTGKAPFRVQWVDGAVNPISGYRIEEVLALGCWLPMVHPDDRQTVADYLLSLVPGDRKSIEFRIVTQQQDIRWVSEKSQCDAGKSDGELILLGAVTDITERKRAEEALRDSESFLQEATKIARLGRWRWNILTNEIDWSTVTQEILGLASLGSKITYADFIGTVHPDDRDALEAAVRDALDNGNDYAIEHRIVLPDGSLRHVQEKGSVHYHPDGKPLHMVGTVLDVTEQKLLEERLKENDRIKNEFIATASHELRTPLTSIMGFSEMMLKNTNLSAEQHREFLSVIHDKSLALEKIVTDLLDISRVETGRIICLEFEKSNIVEEIRQVVVHFQRECSDYRISMTLPEEAIYLSFDKAKIIQVLENLLGNAVKFSHKGSEIVVRAELLDGCLQVMVADEGVGISPENQDYIFDKFYRVDSTNTSVPGLGIGLYLVKKIIETHRGKVWIESVLGKRTKFIFTLPLRSN